MKKILLFVAVLTLFVGLNVSAKTVDVQKARLAGKNFYAAQLSRILHQAVALKDVAISSEFVEKAGDVPAYYVFNFSGNGYIIISADDCCYPVIGYSFESHYNLEQQPDQFVFWMGCRKQEIIANIQGNIQPDPDILDEWNKLESSDLQTFNDGQSVVTDVAPLLTSTFDQGFPYNLLCPADPDCASLGGHVTVGCVATAMAQIMYYWRWPITGTGSHCYTAPGYGQQCADFGNTTYDWNGMTDSPTQECYPVALISYHAGVSVNMKYNSDGQCSSGAYQYQVPNALKTYFKYASTCVSADKSSYSTTDWNNLLQGDLSSGKPIQYGGQGPGGGHSWVCDGFQGTSYYHMNWGWSGSSNGYFYLNNLNPSGYTFNSGQEAVIHVAPNPSLYPNYCTGNALVNTYDFGSLDDGSGPVADYQNGSNCSWLIAPDDSVNKITLNFSRFNTATGDLVKVYDGTDASSPLLGTYSGALSVMPTVTSTGPAMFVTFITDGSGTAPGWKANYTCDMVKFCASSTTLVDGWGTIVDGSGHFDYRNSSNCKWKIMPAGATKIVLTPTSFNTELTTDRLQIYDLGTSALLATWSGNYTTLPSPLVSTTGSVMLIWTTNSSVRGEGWEISYSPMVGTEEASVFHDINVYPNPASRMFFVDFNLIEPQSVKIELLSVQGSALWEDNLRFFKGKYSNTVDVSGFDRGIYMLRLKSDRGTTVKKIVVQ